MASKKGGIGTTIKTFCVCNTSPKPGRHPLLNLRFRLILGGNDEEDDRHSSDSILGARALREIYLMPFMLAWSFVAAKVLHTFQISKFDLLFQSWNRVNGDSVL